MELHGHPGNAGDPWGTWEPWYMRAMEPMASMAALGFHGIAHSSWSAAGGALVRRLILGPCAGARERGEEGVRVRGAREGE